MRECFEKQKLEDVTPYDLGLVYRILTQNSADAFWQPDLNSQLDLNEVKRKENEIRSLCLTEKHSIDSVIS